MIRTALWVRFSVMLGLLVVAVGTAAADDKETLKALAGKWTLTANVIDGEEVPADVANKLSVTFKDDTMTMRGGLAKAGNRYIPTVSVVTYKVTLGTADKLNTIDLKENKEGGRTQHGIYKLEKGKLTICLNLRSGGERPTAFESKDTSGISLMTCEKK